ncbi:MAG TPA: HEAT repeat domain-containing protein [Thermoanaerobaculia bacterium]
MATSIEHVRDFVMQIEKALAAHRLYNPTSAPYREANEKVVEKCHAAAREEPFILRFGPTDLFLDKTSVINRPKRDESFFFTLYRDGLRELTFTSETSAADLESLMTLFETKDQQLGTVDDMVNYLWRLDLSTISHNAIDGIGEMEDDGSGAADFSGLVADLAEKITAPAPPETGQKYSVVLDADVNVAAKDLHYDATTVRKTFEQNPAVLRLTEQQTSDLRQEISVESDQHLMERFVEILLLIIRLPFKSIDPAKISAILGQLVEGYWQSRELDKSTALLMFMRAAAQEAPNPAARAALDEVITRFLSDERLGTAMSAFIGGAIPVSFATRLWDVVPDAQIWPLLLDAYAKLVDGEARNAVLAALRRRLAAHMDLLAAAFSSPEAGRVRAALALLDERTERVFANQIVGLTSHPDEGIRLKGLATVARFGGPQALEILWRAMESDPSKSVRLYAFRTIQSAKLPGLAPRLQSLVNSPQFAERPVWEREKYVRLLGHVAGAAVEPLFESWIPSKRWMWQQKDLEMLELALRGLGSCGDSGYRKVQQIAESGGKPAEVARKVLDSISRTEIGETAMRPLPESAKK